MNYLLLLIGFALLIKGADLFVDGASSLAKKLRVPSMLIGLTIVAFGTSAPEAAVSINAALKSSSGLAVGNIVGSNIFNILLVVGIAAMIKPISIKMNTILKEFPFMLLATVVLYILGNDIKFQGNSINILTQGDGLIILSIFAVFLYYLVEMAILSKEANIESPLNEEKEINIYKSVILGIVGLGGILFGSDLVVKNSTSIALQLGMSETLVGLTIVAVGTSLPELVTSLVAARKGEGDIAVGNVIGSNLFNILFILGVSSVIAPLAVESKILVDIIFLLGITILTYLFAITKKRFSRVEGAMLTLLYIAYTVYIIIRN
ncbi:calcium/sodium antiporter [Alkaliphilus sp. MSJ-5]|uniref:Calcium/sodium antiporter n=1 Tax=Alkaliphilus flagellatus TaxID=2841507 RepID=A0ABS6FY60_9FIRM|nr:calcium/sodium antiporter [Alkaliphilus flagellatus]MBU5675171.1 calcium/sodium antiporter [Alkaliphilus flagellatus]